MAVLMRSREALFGMGTSRSRGMLSMPAVCVVVFSVRIIIVSLRFMLGFSLGRWSRPSRRMFMHPPHALSGMASKAMSGVIMPCKVGVGVIKGVTVNDGSMINAGVGMTSMVEVASGVMTTWIWLA